MSTISASACRLRDSVLFTTKAHTVEIARRIHHLSLSKRFHLWRLRLGIDLEARLYLSEKPTKSSSPATTLSLSQMTKAIGESYSPSVSNAIAESVTLWHESPPASKSSESTPKTKG